LNNLYLSIYWKQF